FPPYLCHFPPRLADLRFPTHYYHLLLPVLNRSGRDSAELLQRLALTRSALEEPGCSLQATQVQALVDAVLASDPDPTLALRLGRQIKPSSHQMLGLAMLSAATLGQSLQLAERYWSLLTPVFGLRSRTRGRSLGLCWFPRTESSGDRIALSDAVLRFHAEALLAGMYEELRFLLGEVPTGCRIELPKRWLRARADYRWLRPAAVVADPDAQRSFSLWLPQRCLSQTLLLADAAACRDAEQHCARLLAGQHHPEGGMAEWIRQWLQQAELPLPSLPQLAAALHLSARTLQRRLAEEGQCYRQLLDDERHRRACHALRERGDPVTSVALALGYSDPANFSRAFSRRAGVRPSAFRRPPVPTADAD
ncbi:MAG: AraC family transcriptional regulator ligand-binding domain-containing protein, partial [Xanthomonadales bacterium]|nr:AraC family transcriptional regulator ligand-binding domain-containing protein [Xanthomonadales bacterium]